MMDGIEPCPLCGAPSRAWADNPRRERVHLVMALADIRIALGVNEKPMLGELAGIVRALVAERDALKGEG